MQNEILLNFIKGFCLGPIIVNSWVGVTVMCSDVIVDIYSEDLLLYFSLLNFAILALNFASSVSYI